MVDGSVLVAMAIVESKTAGPPSPVDRILWSMGHRPVCVSKFGTGLAALYPELPANRWRRALAPNGHARIPPATWLAPGLPAADLGQRSLPTGGGRGP